METIGRWEVTALITIDAGETTELPVPFKSHISHNKVQHLIHIRTHLREALDLYQPDLVCHFPFGIISGIRGIANAWIISFVERVCKQHKIPCCTLMYALTHGGNTIFHQLALRNVYRNQHSGAQRQIRFGVRLPEPIPVRLPAARTGEKNILFMAGMSEPSEERLQYTLDVRGLRFLLKAGKDLAPLGYRLMVAIPLLRDEKLLHALQHEADNLWNSGSIEYLAEVKIPDIFSRTALFAFPYAIEEMQFVPTSIVEAMRYSIPVIMPKLKFLAPFYQQNEMSLVYEPGSVSSFLEQIQLCQQEVKLDRMCLNAKKYIDSHYDIKNSVEDIEHIYHGR